MERYYNQYAEIAKEIKKCRTMDKVREKYEADDEDRYCDISELIFIRYKDIEIVVEAFDYYNYENSKCGIRDKFKYYNENGEEIGELSYINRVVLA